VLSLQKLHLRKPLPASAPVPGAPALAAAAGFGLVVLGLAVFGSGSARAEALLLVDAESGKVLNEQNATAPWYPASVTKLMTTYVTFKALRDRRITRDSLFTVSPNAVAQQPSKMGFKPGVRVTVDNALKMMLVHSANDMAIVLAEGVAGSIERFAVEMNAEARRLGMTQTSYVNPNGLPDEQQVTSARDLAILARALIRDFPEYDEYWHIASIRLGRKVYRNTNKLIDAYAGSDGMKTGFICASGYNLVATATRSGKRLIAVVLGSTSANGRAVRAAQLFERGFGTDPLSWLKFPSTVEALQPIAAAPPDMHDEVCSKDRHQPAAEDGDEGGAGAPSGFSIGDWPLAGLRGASVLTTGLAAGVAPIDVYTGPARPPGWTPPPLPPAPPGKKKPTAVAAKPPAGTSPGKPAAGPSRAVPAPATAAAGARAKPAVPTPPKLPAPKPAVPTPHAAPADDR
jgi:D-alanyl-D-alanine carboxypeptidase